jgi:hypothetical protein
MRPMVVMDFGCRPIATRRHILGPAPVHNFRESPRELGRDRAASVSDEL